MAEGVLTGLAARSIYPCSQLDVGPCGWVIIKRIVVSWVREFTVVVLGVQIALSSLGDSQEVGNVLLVGEVLVQVVLEVLELVHVALDKLVSPDSWEREGLIIKLPSVNIDLWVLAHLLQLVIDLDGIVVILHVKSS